MRDYKVYHHVRYKRDDEFKEFSSTVIEVLPELKGKLWNEVTLAFVHGLRPSAIRVTEGVMTCDGVTNRVTVLVDEKNHIKKITQEVEVGLPEKVAHASALHDALRYGIDSPQCQWHNDDQITGYIMGFGQYLKQRADGTTVPYPEPNDRQSKAVTRRRKKR